jgi:hypothetical protein
VTRRRVVVNGRLGLLCSVGDNDLDKVMATMGLKRLHAVEPGEHYALCGTTAGGLIRRRWNTLRQPKHRQLLKDGGYRFCAQCTRLARLRDAARTEAILLARISGS